MRTFATVALWMASMVFLVFAIASAVAIYGFNSYEPAWGKGGSVQISWWLSFGAALLVLVGAGAGAKLAGNGRVARAKTVAITGVSFALLSITVFWLLSIVEFAYSYILVFPWFVLVPAFIGYYLPATQSSG
jgi:hypothetical protein